MVQNGPTKLVVWIFGSQSTRVLFTVLTHRHIHIHVYQLMGVFCDRLKFGSTAALDCCTLLSLLLVLLVYSNVSLVIEFLTYGYKINLILSKK
jgi:hypothetical protein